MLGFSSLGFAQRNSRMRSAIDSMPYDVTLLEEPRFLINVHAGYAYGLGSTFRFYPDEIHSISITKVGNGTPVTDTRYRYNYKRLGDGLRLGVGASYIISDFINVGLDIDYFKSVIFKTRDSSFYQTLIPGLPGQPDAYGYRGNGKITYEATLINFSPFITFKAISRSKWYMYNKIGAVITYRPNSIQDEVMDIRIRKAVQGFNKDSFSRVVKKYEWGMKKPALGVMAAIGIQVKASGKVRLFGELQFAHIVSVVDKRSLTEFTIDQNDMKNTLPLNMRETEFVKVFSTNANEPDKPSQMLTERMPITYIGAQIGIALQIR